jgi:hypothetical protein
MKAGPERMEISPRLAGWLALAAIVASIGAFFWLPLFSHSASIHWDAADVQYPLQKYFAARLHDLPFWTPYLYSGYPLLASPAMGAWYPLNWPFFLIGISPLAIQWELAVHALIACVGMYLLLARYVARRGAAVVGSFGYGFSGFFVSYAGNPAVFAAAAWFPWVILAAENALRGNTRRGSVLGALAGGMMLLSGFPQIAAFGFVGLAVWVLAYPDTSSYARRSIVVGSIVAGSLLLASVQLLPYIELVAYSSHRQAFSAADSIPRLKWLLTLFVPNAVGTISGTDKGRIVDHYFYSGLLLVPLAAFGAARWRLRRPAVVLAALSAWYFIGPWGGLYWLGAVIPGLQSSGPAILGRFLTAFALAVLAAAGIDWLIGRWKRAAVWGAVCAAILFADLWYWNSFRNPLFYARHSFQDLYGSREEFSRYRVAGPQLSLYRFDSPPLRGVGPLLFPLDLKLETTFGTLGVVPDSYVDYLQAMRANTKLRDGLNVNRYMDLATRTIENSETALPRTYFPRTVEVVRSEDESRNALHALDPAVKSIVLQPPVGVIQDAEASAAVSGFDEQSYRIHYRCGEWPALLKLAVSWYPGWEARVEGEPVPLVRVDHALMGAIVPPGEHDVEFRFHSRWFAAGEILSCLALATAMLLVFGERFLPKGRAAALKLRAAARG